MGVENIIRNLLFGERRKCATQVSNDRRLTKRMSAKASERFLDEAVARLTHCVSQASERPKK